MATIRIAELLGALDRHRVEYILVGSGAAVLWGAGYTTDDVDIVPRLSDENLSRLVAALDDLDARYDDPAGRIIRPDARRLRENRMSLLRTRAGRLDVLQSIAPERRYEDLVETASSLSVEGMSIRVVDLDSLIRAKELADRPKDRLHLPFLRETQRLIRAKAGDD